MRSLECWVQFCATYYERHGHTGESLAKGCKGGYGTGGSDLQGKAKRAGTTQPGEEKAQGGLIDAYKYLVGGVKKTEADSSQRYPAKGKEATDTD